MQGVFLPRQEFSSKSDDKEAQPKTEAITIHIGSLGFKGTLCSLSIMIFATKLPSWTALPVRWSFLTNNHCILLA